MPTDRELLRAICDHDAASFEVFFARHGERVRRHLLRIVRNADTADDLLQEVFLRVWLRAEQWDDRGSCAAWLLRIATNLALNHLRSLRRKREVPLEALSGESDDESESIPGWMIDTASLAPETVCEQAEQRCRIQRLIGELPDEKRTVVHLVHEVEMEIRDVAELLGIPEGTVKSRLHYARKHLAREWKALNRDEEAMRWE